MPGRCKVDPSHPHRNLARARSRTMPNSQRVSEVFFPGDTWRKHKRHQHQRASDRDRGAVRGHHSQVDTKGNETAKRKGASQNGVLTRVTQPVREGSGQHSQSLQGGSDGRGGHQLRGGGRSSTHTGPPPRHAMSLRRALYKETSSRSLSSENSLSI